MLPDISSVHTLVVSLLKSIGDGSLESRMTADFMTQRRIENLTCSFSLPACAIAMVVAFIFLRKYLHRNTSAETDTYGYYTKNSVTRGLAKLQRIDWLGTILFVAGGILIILALNWGSTKGWESAPVIVGFVVGTLLVLVCLAWQHLLGRKASQELVSSGRAVSRWPDQLLPLDLFRSYDICASQLASFVGGMVMLVVFYFLSVYLVRTSLFFWKEQANLPTDRLSWSANRHQILVRSCSILLLVLYVKIISFGSQFLTQASL
jgi:hypothetical protein